MKKRFIKQIALSIREIIFGLEDGLVSTLGTLTGVAVGSNNRYVVVLAGLVLVAVEATSMAAGSYLSSKSARLTEEALQKESGEPVVSKKEVIHPIRAGLVMWVFYALGGMVPLVPYLVVPLHQAFWLSVVLTVAVLFFIGAASARFTKQSALKSGLEMMIVSFGAALIGYGIGWLVSTYLPGLPR